MIELNKIYLGNCLQEMPNIPDKSIDMILTDLPYGTTACKWDEIIPIQQLWTEWKRIIKDDGAIVLTATQPFSSSLVMSNLEMFKYEWIWDKSRAVGFPNAKNKPMNKHESILVFSKGDCANLCHLRMKYNPQGLKKFNKLVDGTKDCEGDIDGHGFARPSHEEHHLQEYTNYPNTVLSISNEGDTEHPTQKPVELFEYLIKTYTNESETVLDCCAGSGTTAIACLNTNRNYICIEKEPKYFEVMKNRIEKHSKMATKKDFGGYFK